MSPNIPIRGRKNGMRLSNFWTLKTPDFGDSSNDGILRPMHETGFEQQDLIREFQALPTWEERYKRIIEFGKALPPMPEELHTEDLKIRGCQSQVWLHAQMDHEGRIHFQADSDALIVKGLIALLLRIYSNRTPAEIIHTAPDFISELGFATHLSPSRANGLMNMVKQIKYYAVAFAAAQGEAPL